MKHRFVFYINESPSREDHYRVVVVELRNDRSLDYYHDPFVVRSSTSGLVKQVLKRTPFTHDEGVLHHWFRQAERTVLVLNRMCLALEAAELEHDGIRNLFNKVWESENV